MIRGVAEIIVGDPDNTAGIIPNLGTDYSFPNFRNWGMSSLSPNSVVGPCLLTLLSPLGYPSRIEVEGEK